MAAYKYSMTILQQYQENPERPDFVSQTDVRIYSFCIVGKNHWRD